MRRRDGPPPRLRAPRRLQPGRVAPRETKRETPRSRPHRGDFQTAPQRHTRASKHPRATALLRVALYGITILPLLHILPSYAMPEDQRMHSLPTTDTCTISYPAM